MPAPLPPTPTVVSKLEAQLRMVAHDLRATRLHRRATVRWLIVAGLGLLILGMNLLEPAFSPYALPVMGLVIFGAILQGMMLAKRDPLNYQEAARLVEAQYPELREALRTAAEQKPAEDGGFHFLQLRVIGSALNHAWRNNWRKQPRQSSLRFLAGHAAALALAFVLAGILVLQNAGMFLPKPKPIPVDIAVSPGNAEVERGSTVVISARFDKKLPRFAELVWTQADGKTGRAPMARSLSDPVFAFTLPAVAANVSYTVAYSGEESTPFALTVFDQPALVKADATLNYPEYTGTPSKKIEDTRRVSAISGTKLDYDFTMNKPMKAATLVAEDGREIPLTATNPERTQFNTSFVIDQTQRYTLRMQDDRDRKNPQVTDIRIVALENRAPRVNIDFPRGDVVVSSLEEIRLQATARDDFGLVDYGLAVSVGDKEPQMISLRNTTKAEVQAKFENLLALEPQGIKPDQLVSWYAYANDLGPDGQKREITTDLFFAEVRPFEEIFHEAPPGAGGGGQQGQQGQQQQQGTELQELQKQIAIGVFKLRQQSPPGTNFTPDINTLHQSQEDAQAMLAEAAANLENPRAQAAATEAARLMKVVLENLTTANEKRQITSLTPAWTAAQGAYQALLRLNPREFQVTQQRQGQPGQQQQQRQRNQNQLNQLRFRQQQDRYQNQNEAQQPTTPEQRQQLQAESRLRDLTRRQQDINQRLQDMQTALAAEQDAAKREELQRELKRLEEEQRNMLANLDDARQQLDRLQPNDQTQQARQQLDQAREDMRRASEQMEQGQVSQALAAGTRAGDALQNTAEDLRRDTSNNFAQQMRDARQQARELDTQQQTVARELAQMGQNRALDDAARRQELAQTLDQQRKNLDSLVNNLRQVTEDSEATEPALHRQLYDLLRQQGQTSAPTQLQSGAELLRRGFVDQSRDLQNNVAQNFEQLRRRVERAAESVLGDDTEALRFAQNELSNLAQQLQGDRPAGADPQAGDPAQPNGGERMAANQNNPNGEQNGQAGQRGQQGAQAGQPGGRQGANGQRGQAGGEQVAQNGDGERQATDAQNGNQPGGRQGEGGQNGQRGQGGQAGGEQVAQNGGGDRQATDAQNGNQPGGQRGQGGQAGQNGDASGLAWTPENGWQVQEGQRGQGGQAGGEQVAQNSSDQPNGGQPGQRGQPGQPGQAGQRGQGGQQPGQGGQGQLGGEQLAQDATGENGSNQPGGRQGANPQAGGRQGQAGQRGQAGQGGQRGQGNQPGQGGQGGQGDQAGGEQLAQDATDLPAGGDASLQAEQPGQNGRGGQQPGQGGRQGPGGQRGQGGNLAQNGNQPGGRQGPGNGPNGGRAGGNNYNGGPGGGAYNGVDQILQQFSGGGTDRIDGPITGGNFAEWADRLVTVEQLIDDPQLRQQVAAARAQAEELRRDFQRHSTTPQWEIVQSNIISPLNAVRNQLRQDLARRDQPESLQPVDRDPVPEKYADSVQRYYEALGN